MPNIKGRIDKKSVMATVPDVTGIGVGALVSGRGIVPGTTVAEIRGPNAVQLSQGATENLSAVDLVFQDMPEPEDKETEIERLKAENARLTNLIDPLDHNGDGLPGGSLPKAPVVGAAKPVVKPATKTTTRMKK